MTGRQSLALILAQTLVGLVVLACATYLAAVGKLEGEAVTALFGTAVGLVGGVTATVGYSTTNGAAQRQVTQRQNAGKPPDGTLPESVEP